MAEGLGAEVEEIRGSLDRRLTNRDIDVAFGTIKAGTCGAVCTRAAGVVDGREAIVIVHIIRMARDVAPDWLSSECDATYRVDIEGDPDIHCSMTLGEAEGHGAGRGAMAATAMRVVNAIPYVVEAPAGLLSSLDLPMTLPRYALSESPRGFRRRSRRTPPDCGIDRWTRRCTAVNSEPVRRLDHQDCGCTSRERCGSTAFGPSNGRCCDGEVSVAGSTPSHSVARGCPPRRSLPLCVIMPTATSTPRSPALFQDSQTSSYTAVI